MNNIHHYQRAFLRKLNSTEWNTALVMWRHGADTLMIARKLGVHESVIANGLYRVWRGSKGIAA